MTRRTLSGWAVLFASFAFSAGSHAADDSVDLKPVSSGVLSQLHYYMPNRLELSPTKPTAIKKAPQGLSAPLYGVLNFGAPDASPSKFAIIIDEPAGKDYSFYFDANGNGDLTDDPPVPWTIMGPNIHQGSVTLPLSKDMSAHLMFYRFDKNDPQRAALASTLLYYRDYARIGHITLNGKTYEAILTDDAATGDFRGKNITPDSPRSSSGVSLLIDVNGDGKYANRGERFDVRQPFKIDGVAYEIKDMKPDGEFAIARSKQDVEEVKAPPSLKGGEPALSFAMPTTDGKQVNFPADYKGKIVMLDFWATWCGPCMGEVPNLVATYDKYHPQGFEVLGITLDQPNSLDKVNQVTKDKGMSWRQVYDGKAWEAKIAQLYGIESIPAAFLVDGDTGKIIAAGQSLRGDGLAPAIEKALKEKAAAARTAAAN